MFCKKVLLRNFAKFTGKHLCQSLFFNKVAGLRPESLIKKETPAKLFSCEFCEISENTYRTPAVAPSDRVIQVYLGSIAQWDAKKSKKETDIEDAILPKQQNATDTCHTHENGKSILFISLFLKHIFIEVW